MTNNPIIFDRRRVQMHRDRAVRLQGDDFLLREMAVRAKERLEELNQNFDVALELGAHTGTFAEICGGSDKIKTHIQTELSEAMAGAGRGRYIVADEEFLPIRSSSVELCISVGSMHWINDLPGSLVQMNHALKPGGALLAILPGGETLKELRASFEQAEMEISGGVSPRISPFVDSREMSGLLQRAGFTDPVVDTETLTLEYDHPLKLLKELRSMGQASTLIHSKKNFTPVSLMMLMADMYMRKYMNDEGRIPATIELVTLTAWKQ